MQAYNEAIAKAKPPDTRKFSDLITLYKIHRVHDPWRQDAKGLFEVYQTDRNKVRHHANLGTWGPLFAACSKSGKTNWRRKACGMLIYAWTVLQRILAVAKDRGKITTNPCERGGRLCEADRSDKLWTDDHVKQFF
jgi:hypothetical protein